MTTHDLEEIVQRYYACSLFERALDYSGELVRDSDGVRCLDYAIRE